MSTVEFGNQDDGATPIEYITLDDLFTAGGDIDPLAGSALMALVATYPQPLPGSGVISKWATGFATNPYRVVTAGHLIAPAELYDAGWTYQRVKDFITGVRLQIRIGSLSAATFATVLGGSIFVTDDWINGIWANDVAVIPVAKDLGSSHYYDVEHRNNHPPEHFSGSIFGLDENGNAKAYGPGSIVVTTSGGTIYYEHKLASHGGLSGAPIIDMATAYVVGMHTATVPGDPNPSGIPFRTHV